MSETSKQLWGFCESCHCQQIAICQDCKRLLREAIIDDEADLKAFMSSHAFQAGDEKQGWENQCAVIAPDGLRHCGGYREDHPMSNKSTLSDGWCEYANHLISHGNDITALSMRTNLLADMNAHTSHTAAIREKAEALVAKIEWASGFLDKVLGEMTDGEHGWMAALEKLKPELTALKAELDKEQR